MKVKLARHTSNAEQLPLDWPVQVFNASDTPSGDYVELSLEEIEQLKAVNMAEYVATISAQQQTSEQLRKLSISFEEMPLKLPGLAWQMMEDLGLTKVERKALIRGLGDFYAFIQSGHIALAVEALNEASKPSQVPQAAWDSLVAQVNYVIELNSINK